LRPGSLEGERCGYPGNHVNYVELDGHSVQAIDETGASVQLGAPGGGYWIPYVAVDTLDEVDEFRTLGDQPCPRCRGVQAPTGRRGEGGEWGAGGSRAAVDSRPAPRLGRPRITVLGRYRGGTDRFVNDPRYNTLNLPKTGPGSWNWTKNKRFLDKAITRGDEIRLVTNPRAPQYSGGNVFQREVRYLKDRGYRFVKRGDYWMGVRTR